MLYLISSMRTFVSLRKCLVSQWDSRDSRPNPQSLLKAIQTPVNTRPLVSNWTKPDCPQKQTQTPVPGPSNGLSQGQTVPYIQNQVHYPHNTPGGYPVTIMPSNVQPSMRQNDNNVSDEVEEDVTEAKASQDNKELLAKIEVKFHEYQRSLWDLQRAGMPGLPQGMYPSISHGHLTTHGEGEP